MDKLKRFAELLEKQQREHLERQGLLANGSNTNQWPVHIKQGKKYTKIDVGPSGKYMVENSTGDIYGIKAYGVIHRGHKYGNLDTISLWDWSGYVAQKIA